MPIRSRSTFRSIPDYHFPAPIFNSFRRTPPFKDGRLLVTTSLAGYFYAMTFELVIHTPEGDIVLGSCNTLSAAEKLAAIAVPPGENWSVVEAEGEAHPATVIDFAAFRARREARRRKI